MKRNILTIALCILAFSLGIGINNFAFSDINTAKVAYVDVNKLVAASKTIKSERLPGASEPTSFSIPKI